MEKGQVSLEMIALAAGVSKSTVSRALRGYHWTANETACRIQKIARELGYVPDARLAELTAHLRKRKRGINRPSLALLHTSDNPIDLKGERSVAQGFMKRSREMGYSLDVFRLKEPTITAEHLSRVWWNRGINGVIVYPLERPGSLKGFRWELFSWVTTGFSLRSPEMHRVAIDFHQVMWTGMTRLIEQGDQRAGLYLSPSLDERTAFRYRSAYQSYYESIGVRVAAPILAEDLTENPQRVEDWIIQNRLDIVIVLGAVTAQLMKAFLSRSAQLQRNPPRVVNFACDGPTSDEEGIFQDSREIGSEAVDYLVQLIHRNEKGIPPVPRTIMIPGIPTTKSPLRQRHAH